MYSLLNLFSPSLCLALWLSKPIACLSVAVFSIFLFFSPATLLHSSLPFSLWPLCHSFFSLMTGWLTTPHYTHSRLRSPSHRLQQSPGHCSAERGPGGLTQETLHLTLSMGWSWRKLTLKSQFLGTASKRTGLWESPPPAGGDCGSSHFSSFSSLLTDTVVTYGDFWS